MHAENDYLIIAGNMHHNGNKPTAYVAKVGWGGNIIWKIELPVPAHCRQLNVDGGENLARMPDGNFILGGVVEDTTAPTPLPVKQPFLYRFNSSGSTISWQFFNDTTNRHFGALDVAANGKIAVAFLQRTEVGDYDLDGYDARIIAQLLNTSGIPIWKNSGGFETGVTRDLSSIEGILPDTADEYFRVFATIGIAPSSDPYSFLDFNTVTGALRTPFPGGGYAARPPYDNSAATGFPTDYRYKFIHNYNHTGFFYGFQVSSLSGDMPAIAYGPSPDWGYNASNWNTVGIVTDTLPYVPIWDKHFALHAATNGDLLIAKSLVGADTNLAFPIPLDSIYTFPIVLRTDSAGAFKSIQFYRKVPQLAPQLQHYFNKIAQSPDGSKYALVGSIENNFKKRPGVWDTLGSTSWLVILDENPISLPEPLLQQVDFSVYPNPATDLLHIDYLRPKSSGKCVALLYDMTGRLVSNLPLSHQQNQLDIKRLVSGTYLLTVIQNYVRIAEQKIIIQ